MFSGEENWPKAGKCELPPSSSPSSSWHTSESFMLKVCLAMLEIPHVQCVKFTPDKERGTFWLHNQCLGFILIQWKCFWFGFFLYFGNSKRIKIGSWFFFSGAPQSRILMISCSFSPPPHLLLLSLQKRCYSVRTGDFPSQCCGLKMWPLQGNSTGCFSWVTLPLSVTRT